MLCYNEGLKKASAACVSRHGKYNIALDSFMSTLYPLLHVVSPAICLYRKLIFFATYSLPNKTVKTCKTLL